MWLFNRGTEPTAPEGGRDYTLYRMDVLISWYRGRAKWSSLGHKISKLLTILLGAAISLMAVIEADAIWLAAAGAAVVAITGIQELYQFHGNWIKDATTKELLLREQSLYRAKAGPYAPTQKFDPDRILAERTEAVVAKELEAWIAGQKDTTAFRGGESTGTTGTGTKEK